MVEKERITNNLNRDDNFKSNSNIIEITKATANDNWTVNYDKI